MRFCILTAAICVLTWSQALAQWEPERQLTFSPGWSFLGGVCAGGDTVRVVWRDDRTGREEAFFKQSFDRGSTWSEDAQLSAATDGVTTPNVAALDGRVHVAWCQTRDETSFVFYRRSTDGGATWEPESVLTTGGLNWPTQPYVAAEGQFVHLFWMAYTAGECRVVRGRRSTDRGATWEPELLLSEDSVYGNPPRAAVDGPFVHLLWEQWNGRYQQLRYRRSADRGATWEPLRWLTGTIVSHMSPWVAAESGRVHVVCESDLNAVFQPFYLHSSDNGMTWSSAVCLGAESCPGYSPCVIASGTNVHVLWQDGRAGNEVYYRSSTDGGETWVAEQQLSHDTANSFMPQLAVGGTAVYAVWVDHRNGKPDLFYVRNLTGNSAIADPAPPVRPQVPVHTTIVRGVLVLGAVDSRQNTGYRADLLNITGRKVMELVPGPNDVRHLAPGVYFIREPLAVSREPSAVTVRKVIITR
jgi:hypothetical protein